jgi:hypothetical protein
VRDFDANRFFLAVMSEALLEKDGSVRFGNESAVRGEMDISGTVVRFDMFPNKRGISGHGKSSLEGSKRTVNGTRV